MAAAGPAVQEPTVEDVENIHFQMDALMHVALKTGQWEALPEETKNALLVAS